MRNRLLLLSTMLAGLMSGQVSLTEVDTTSFFMSTYELSLSGTGAAFSLQVPPKSTKRVYLRGVLLECSVNCTVMQDKNGTAATGTVVAAVPLNTDATPVAALYRNSDAGTGSQLLPINVTGGIQQPVDMSFTVFSRGNAAAQNMNWRVSAITGTARVTVIWGEK